jgi:hypothetical protein
MRKKEKKQLPIMIASIDHPHTIELVHISQILDGNSIICEMALQDLVIIISGKTQYVKIN